MSEPTNDLQDLIDDLNEIADKISDVRGRIETHPDGKAWQCIEARYSLWDAFKKVGTASSWIHQRQSQAVDYKP